MLLIDIFILLFLAIEEEKKQQRRTLLKQRKEYVKKQETLKSDLEHLVKQKKELISERRPDNEPFISKNIKLQVNDHVFFNKKSYINFLKCQSGWSPVSSLSLKTPFCTLHHVDFCLNLFAWFTNLESSHSASYYLGVHGAPKFSRQVVPATKPVIGPSR